MLDFAGESGSTLPLPEQPGTRVPALADLLRGLDGGANALLGSWINTIGGGLLPWLAFLTGNLAIVRVGRRDGYIEL